MRPIPSLRPVRRRVARAAVVARARIAERSPLMTSAVDVGAMRRRRRVVQHRSLRRPWGMIVPEIAPEAEDVVIARRLLAAHRATVESMRPELAQPDLWTLIAAGQRGFRALLDRDDPDELAAYLCNVSRHDASEGIVQGAAEHRRLLRDPVHRSFVARMAHDKLVLLAEAVGAVAPDNPEQGEQGRAVRRSPAELVAAVEAVLGLKIAPPAIDGGLLKLDTGRGLFGERDLNAIYTAHLMRSLCDAQASSVVEIGGGSGRVAHWAWRLGLASYTIIDLPLVNVVQGYYALKSRPHEDVVLHGEPDPGGFPDGLLRIKPAHALADLEEVRADLVLNQDSLPEMSPATAAAYLSWIARGAGRRFVSINHESRPAYGDGLAHISVHELAGATRGLQLQHRFPYWLRRGYVLELYATLKA